MTGRARATADAQMRGAAAHHDRVGGTRHTRAENEQDGEREQSCDDGECAQAALPPSGNDRARAPHPSLPLIRPTVPTVTDAR